VGGYSVKSVFLTLQGEGRNTGRLAVFCRFAGCNLWNGREPDRAGAACTFCDTDFVGVDGPGGGKYPDAQTLAAAVLARWPVTAQPFVVFTGGEPTLQLDDALIDAFRRGGCELAVETNGTRPVVDGVDWICVSPKAGALLRQRQGNEIKIAWPQPVDLDELERLPFMHRYLQPIDGPNRDDNIRETIRMCRTRPAWRLSIQMHKIVGIP
jgi:7-carboxy-7-deazaguanine synthase (Cx14CxxC type)